MGDINLIGDKRVITADTLLKPEVNVKISEAAKEDDAHIMKLFSFLIKGNAK